jgi:hypothetical protein
MAEKGKAEPYISPDFLPENVKEWVMESVMTRVCHCGRMVRADMYCVCYSLGEIRRLYAWNLNRRDGYPSRMPEHVCTPALTDTKEGE